ncbi:MAG: hypothetical protein ACOZNI_04550 [Myxococcota bacterium]
MTPPPCEELAALLEVKGAALWYEANNALVREYATVECRAEVAAGRWPELPAWLDALAGGGSPLPTHGRDHRPRLADYAWCVLAPPGASAGTLDRAERLGGNETGQRCLAALVEAGDEAALAAFSAELVRVEEEDAEGVVADAMREGEAVVGGLAYVTPASRARFGRFVALATEHRLRWERRLRAELCGEGGPPECEARPSWGRRLAEWTSGPMGKVLFGVALALLVFAVRFAESGFTLRMPHIPMPTQTSEDTPGRAEPAGPVTVGLSAGLGAFLLVYPVERWLGAGIVDVPWPEWPAATAAAAPKMALVWACAAVGGGLAGALAAKLGTRGLAGVAGVALVTALAAVYGG